MGVILEPSNISTTIQPIKGKVVFTNGCFDILHIGHIRYLQKAKSYGDYLFVGVNSDKSVQRLKGENRPLQPERERAEILAALRCVDYVSIFAEDTPYNLIKIVQPDVLVKGGDWPVNKIVGSDIVLAKGGEVKSLDYIKGRSTSRLVELIGSN